MSSRDSLLGDGKVMKIVKEKGAGIDIIHTTTRKVKSTFFALHCLNCEHLVSHKESKVNFKVECKAEKCDKQ